MGRIFEDGTSQKTCQHILILKLTGIKFLILYKGFYTNILLWKTGFKEVLDIVLNKGI